MFAATFPDADGPGGIALIMSNDTIVYRRAFGLADLKTREAITDSTVFNISGVSKLFTAVGLLKLCEMKKISLDDSLSKFFPELHREVFDHITIRHILTHSSGLPDLRPRNADEWNAYNDDHSSIFIDGIDYALYGDEDEYLKSFLNLTETPYEPGTFYQRDDPAFILAAPLFERVTGEGFETWMNENIFRPAGMKDVFYYNYKSGMFKAAHAYRQTTGKALPLTYISEDGKWEEYDIGEAPFILTRADKGAYCSARDIMQFNRALYSGKILSAASINELNRSYITLELPLTSMGLGAAIKNSPEIPLKSYHINHNGGYSVVEGTWPELHLHYIVLANRADWDRRAVIAYVDSILSTIYFANYPPPISY
jgi:CubicO group peptidase (beta-lactamase class C family)